MTFSLNLGANCNTPLTTSIVSLVNGTATSSQYIPLNAGSYRWVATYSGDANNTSATHACGAANESTEVLKATPTLSTSATPEVAVGQPISDTATLSGGLNPGGTVSFLVFGPDDANCTGAPAFTSSNRPVSNGQATSAGFTPTQAGTYRWRATYNGDLSNNIVAAPCNAPNESSLVVGADLVASKSGPEIVVAGIDYSYTIGVMNNGPAAASNVVLTDTLPAGVTLVSAPGCTGTTTLTCDAGTLTNGQSASFTITVTPTRPTPTAPS